MAELFGVTQGDEHAKSMLLCRQIAKTIVDYGVSDRDIMTIIRLLTYELEDHDTCRELVCVLKELGNSHFLLDEG